MSDPERRDTLQYLAEVLQEHAAARGWRGGLEEHKDAYFVNFVREEEEILRFISLDLDRDKVLVSASVPILAEVDSGVRGGEVELGAPDLEQRLLSLFDQTAEELAQIGWEEVAKARRRVASQSGARGGCAAWRGT